MEQLDRRRERRSPGLFGEELTRENEPEYAVTSRSLRRRIRRAVAQ